MCVGSLVPLVVYVKHPVQEAHSNALCWDKDNKGHWII